ncbi:MAG: DUF190 domain-containing protein [Acidimicrobiales bacterium]
MRTNDVSRFPSHPATRLTLSFNVREHTHHRSLMIQLLQRAQKARLAGATVFEALEGYGASGRLHRSQLLSDDAPAALVIIDRPDRIEAFLLEVADLLPDVFTTLNEVDVVELKPDP